MRIVHVELPRFFTLTVKDYLVETAAALEADGHSFEQFDINPNWWRFVLGLSTPHSPRDLFEPLLAARVDETFWPLLAEVRAHLADVGRLYGVRLGLAGLQLEPAVRDSSYGMCTLVADNYGCTLFSNFFQQLESRLHVLQADVISLGCEGQEGVFWAILLAAWIRSAGSSAHITIGRHAWENFSLLPHVDDLAKNPWFFGVISSIILYQEDLPDTMRRLVAHLAGGAFEGLRNIALKRGEAVSIVPPEERQRTEVRVAEPGYKIPPEYFKAMEVPAEHLVYAMVMVRNKCFYNRCNFCVQTAKHISDQAYSQSAEIQRALAGCEELLRHGVRMVNFMDEAMRPVDLREFCAGVQARGLKLHWVGRMIAAAHPNRALLGLMKQAGCAEILFGLETFDPQLSADMGKVSKAHASAAATSAMVEAFLDAGLFVLLSMIYEFPTERPEARRETLERIAALQAKTLRFAMIFNPFHLLSEARMFKHPADFNIARIVPRLPEHDLQYGFEYECREPLPKATAEERETMQRLRLGLSPERYASVLTRYGAELSEMAFFLDYVSVGLKYRVENDATLLVGAFAGRTAQSC